MPRVSYMRRGAVTDWNHPDYEPDQPMDLCRPCWREYAQGRERLPDFSLGRDQFDSYRDEDGQDGAVITSEESSHPPYEECEYSCGICGDLLTSDDDEPTIALF